MPRAEIEQLGAREAVMVDALGSAAMVTQPAGEAAVRLDLAGRLNKDTGRWQGTFLMAPGQVAELIAELTITGALAAKMTDGGFAAFMDECQAAVRRRRADSDLDRPLT